MKSKTKIKIFVIVTVFALLVGHTLYHLNDPQKLASMIASGDSVGVSRLIKTHPRLVNAEIDSRTRLRPIHLAANRGEGIICSNLISAGANINAQDLAGETPLYFALASTNSGVLQTLLHCGADVSVTDVKGDTPLYYAVVTDNTNAVIMLLKYGANPIHTNRAGKTPLDYAIESTNKDLGKIFSEAILQKTNSAPPTATPP